MKTQYFYCHDCDKATVHLGVTCKGCEKRRFNSRVVLSCYLGILLVVIYLIITH